MCEDHSNRALGLEFDCVVCLKEELSAEKTAHQETERKLKECQELAALRLEGNLDLHTELAEKERQLSAAITARDMNHEQWKLLKSEWAEQAKRIEDFGTEIYALVSHRYKLADRNAQLEAALGSLAEAARLVYGAGTSNRWSDLQQAVSKAQKLLSPPVQSSAVCANCSHSEPHNGPAGCDPDDACTYEGCNCGYYAPRPVQPEAPAKESI